MYALKQTKSHDLLTSLNFNIYVLGGFLHLSCFVVKVLIVGCIIPPWYPKCTRLWYTSCIFFLSSFSQIRSACPKISSFQKFTRCRFHLLRRYPCKIKIIALLLNSLGRMDENSLSFTHLASMKYMSASTISSSVTLKLQMHLQTSSPSEFVMRVTEILKRLS